VLTEDTRELASDIDAKALEDLKAQASENRSIFIARTDPETTAQAGERREIRVDTRKLYFFDPETGEAIQGDRGVAPVGVAGAQTV
jgi:multiple sugar transport system ATP-binding protein